MCHLHSRVGSQEPLIYDYIVDGKPFNFTLTLVPEQHHYTTRIASLQHLNPCSFRTKINIRKFCRTIIGCYYWNDTPISISQNPTKKAILTISFPVLFCSVLITVIRRFCLPSPLFKISCPFSFFSPLLSYAL